MYQLDVKLDDGKPATGIIRADDSGETCFDNEDADDASLPTEDSEYIISETGEGCRFLQLID